MRDIDRDRSSVSERLRVQSEVRTLSDSPRTQIGPYQLIAKIGEGGMGTVWLTKLPGPAGFNKLAVVKELRADIAGSPAFVEMFLNEARLAARLTHPNVIHTYGANEDRGRLYIAMEYLDGQPWSRVRHELWQNRSLPLPLHLKVLADTLTGLHYAHELRDYDGSALQVVHRDVSPQNVFVTYDGLVKVVDFGVARAVSSQRAASDVPTPMFVGKIAYSGPEQLRGEPVDRRADVFAVGVMLWEALAGRRLMEGEDRSEAVRKRASEPAPRIRDVVASVPRQLADICDRALALDPNERFSTALEFRDALTSYLTATAPDLDSAQLGQLVSNAFRDERTRIHGLIERSLMRSTPAVPPPVESLIDTVRPPPGPAEHTIRADLSELASVSRTTDEALLADATHSVVSSRMPAPLPEQSPPPDRRPLWAGLGLLALLLVGWIGYRLATHQPEDVTALPLPADGDGERSDALPRKTRDKAAEGEISIQISAEPKNARIFLDGAPLANPFSGKLKIDADLHILRVTAPGMQTQEKVIQLDDDKLLQIVLVPQAAGERPGERPGERESAQGDRGELQEPGAVTPSSRRPVGSAAASSRSPSGATQAPPSQTDSTGPAAAPARPRAPQPGDSDFDMRITPDAKLRPIYEEDPY